MGFSGRLRRRRSLLAFAVCAPVAAVMLSGCAVGGEGCQIGGVANFTPGLAVTKRAISYTFNGSLTGCKSVGGDATIKSGTVTASGSGPSVGCTGGNTAGGGTITWNNGQTSSLALTTSGALNAVDVTAKVTSGEFAGHTFHAVLAFTVASPAQCNTAGGVTSATFKGANGPA
jgi:hypothetical protein